MKMEFFEVLQHMVESLGYAGVFTAAGLEYACFPISSELLLPFLGYTAARGEMRLWLTIIVCTLAGTLGSFFCYMLGRVGGNFLEHTLCKRFHTLQLGMEKARNVFKRYGKESVFFARMFPIARTYISFPAGMASMDIPLFLLYTALGAFIWNTVLISGGYFLGSHWEEVKLIFEGCKWFLVIALAGALFLLWQKKKRKI